MEKKVNTLILSATDIHRIIEKVGLDKIMDNLIEQTYNAFLEYKKDEIIMSARSGYNYFDPNEGLVEWMPLRDINQEEIFMKMVAYHPNNPSNFQLPTILSTFSKYDTNTGHLKVVMDGVLPTALRTGAASAVASKLFGNPESKTLGLIGCGAQAITQLHALSRVFELDTVLYYDIDIATMNSFRDRLVMLDLDINLKQATINEIVEHADVLSTATSLGIGEGPLFEYNKSKHWLHVNAVGSDFPGKTELPKELLERSYVCPDFMEQAVIEGECQQLSQEQIGKDLISCIKSANQLSHLKEELTVFDSTGMSLEDQIVADLFLNYASEMGIGEYINLESTGIDEKNPYSFVLKPKH